MTRKGDRFEVFKRGKLWYWHLQGAYFPSGPIARSGKGYTTKQAALRSIEAAQRAAKGATRPHFILDEPPIAE